MYSQPLILLATAGYPPIAVNPGGIHGGLLEVTVVGCNKLKDMEWISRQDPYASIEYGSNKNRTGVCTDGGKNPTFQEKFVYTLIEGLRELNISLWNSNTFAHDDFIGTGKVQLGKVLSKEFDDSSWPLYTKTGRHAGEVRLIMQYSNPNANNSTISYVSAPTYGTSSTPPVSMYSAPPPPSSVFYPPAITATGGYPTPFPYSSYPPTSSAVYPPPPSSYPPHSTYPPKPYGFHYPHASPYPGGYPPSY